MAKKKIAMFSFADIDNYGDILFSHIFQKEISERLKDVSIDFYTPSDFEIEGIQYIGYERSKIEKKYDALILAGGEVVHLFDERTWEPIYRKNNQKILSTFASDVVWDWADCEAGFKAWLSVGVRPFENKKQDPKISAAIKNLDYISVRGILSKKILEGEEMNAYESKVNITPDLGWLFPEYLKSKGEYGKLYNKLIPEGRKYAIVQAHNISDTEAEVISKSLLSFREENDMDIFLLPVIHLWEDHKFMQKITDASGGLIKLLPHNLSTLQMADLIVHAELVACSSLHVAITALADGIPAAIINKWQGTKLQDLFGLQFRQDYLSSSFDNVDQLLMKLLKEKQKYQRSLTLYADFMKSKLEIAFDDIAERIENTKS